LPSWTRVVVCSWAGLTRPASDTTAFFSPEPLKPGRYTLGMEFVREGKREQGENLGKAKLYVNDKAVADGAMKTQPAKFTLSGEGQCVGYDSGDAASTEYKAPGKFTGGTIDGVGVTV
jgi:arylsulfatase